MELPPPAEAKDNTNFLTLASCLADRVHCLTQMGDQASIRTVWAAKPLWNSPFRACSRPWAHRWRVRKHMGAGCHSFEIRPNSGRKHLGSAIKPHFSSPRTAAHVSAPPQAYTVPSRVGEASTGMRHP